jgi:peptide/nickel transport system ATP-binding protein
VSALDVSVQAQIVNLLARLQRELDLALLFVSHNLAVVRHVSARILVLYLGRTLELAPREALFASPLHPYTRALLASIPSTRPGAPLPRGVLPGELPSPLDPPSGCVFRTRCPWAISRCAEAVPPLERVEGERYVACHRWREIASGTPP